MSDTAELIGAILGLIFAGFLLGYTVGTIWAKALTRIKILERKVESIIDKLLEQEKG